MAAALFANYRVAGCSRIIRSAGIQGLDGQSAHPLAQEQMQKRGIDISDHRARTVTPNLLTAFDLILVMETSHWSWIATRMPTVRERVYLLGHWRDLEIVDPVYGGRPQFEYVAEEIEECLSDWCEYLRESAGTFTSPTDYSRRRSVR